MPKICKFMMHNVLDNLNSHIIPNIAHSKFLVTFRYGLTPLHQSIIQGNLTAAGELLLNVGNLEDGLEPIDVQKCTPLHYCAMYDKEKLTNILLQKGANRYALNIDKRTALHEACGIGSLPIVKLLLNMNKDDEENALNIEEEEHISEDMEDKKTADDINWKDEEGDTPLMMAIESGSKEIVELLLKLKADPNDPNEAETYPMHVAAKEGAVDIMELLIDVSDVILLILKKISL